nr:alpha/beta fold hydrolase [Halomonas colorata]
MPNAYADYVPIQLDQLPAALAREEASCFMVEGFGPLSVTGQAHIGRLLWAHGAGAGHQSAFMQHMINALAAQGIQVFAIDFPYMQQMMEQGKRRPPPPVTKTLEHFAAWYKLLGPLADQPLWVGGKSMGGRIATMFASTAFASTAFASTAFASSGSTSTESASQQVCPGVIVAGYPFHPPKAPGKLRLSHWADIHCPLLILQGERDPFGTREEVSGYSLTAQTQLEWLTNGDHDFKPRRASGLKHEFLIDEAATLAASFVRAHGTPSGM